MTAVSDAERAVVEAEAVVWGERCTNADAFEAAIKSLVAAVRRHDVEVVRDEGTRYDERTYTRDQAAELFADRLRPDSPMSRTGSTAPDKEPTP